MKRLLCVLMLSFLVSGNGVCAEVIAQWTFDSAEPDGSQSTGTLIPATGNGTVELVGGISSGYAAGGAYSAATNPNDSGLNTATYSGQGGSNKSRGVLFRTSTVGFEDLEITWLQRNSSSSSRYARLQYSADGTTFVDGPVIDGGGGETYVSRVVRLNSIPSVNNNSRFTFRIVTEWESTATGGGAASYVAAKAGSAYSGSGTVRFDLMTVRGAVYTGNSFPVISGISNQTVRMNAGIEALSFTVGDAETPAEGLMLTVESSNDQVVPNAWIQLIGYGSNWTVQAFPQLDVTGVSTITLTVTDGDNKSASTSFQIQVLPENTPPALSDFSSQVVPFHETIAPVAFTVWDREMAPERLTVTATSSNPGLIPDRGLIVVGSGTNRTLELDRIPQTSGNAVVTVTVSDEGLSVRRTFGIAVMPPGKLLINEAFEYDKGPIVKQAGGLWRTHSGAAGQTVVQDGMLSLSPANSEDIHWPFLNRVEAGGGSNVFASFTMTVLRAPRAVGDYFAHFNSGGTDFRGRVMVSTLGATNLGNYRITVLNGTGNITNGATFSGEFAQHTPHLVVVRHEVDTARATLWVNPTGEASQHVMAMDPASTVAITSFAFRENENIGEIRIDNLRVGMRFEDVMPGYRVWITQAGEGVEVSWPAEAMNEGYTLQRASDPAGGNWEPVWEGVQCSGTRAWVGVHPSAQPLFYRLQKER